jgi:hypothetical protein
LSIGSVRATAYCCPTVAVSLDSWVETWCQRCRSNWRAWFLGCWPQLHPLRTARTPSSGSSLMCVWYRIRPIINVRTLWNMRHCPTVLLPRPHCMPLLITVTLPLSPFACHFGRSSPLAGNDACDVPQRTIKLPRVLFRRRELDCPLDHPLQHDSGACTLAVRVNGPTPP